MCPAGVPVGSIMEDARSLVTDARAESFFLRASKRVMLEGVVARPALLSLAITFLRWAERLGLRAAARRVFGERMALLPPIPRRSPPLPEVVPSERKRRKRVALFTGCIASHLFADVNEATARVLARNGFEVIVPRRQVCCGALHLHNGLSKAGGKLARANIDAFEPLGADAVIVNAAGCGAVLTEYGELLEGDPRAVSLARSVVDVSAFLVREGFEAPSKGLGSVRIAYDAPCHLFHGQRVRSEPRELLSRIPGVELVDYRDSERCCGSAGIYNVIRYDMSMKVLETKMRELETTRADVIATGNPGCLLQLSEGVRRSGIGAEVAHPIVLLDRAYRQSSLAG